MLSMMCHEMIIFLFEGVDGMVVQTEVALMWHRAVSHGDLGEWVNLVI